jgi:simple sugar transport system substrate-binding protein
MLVWHSGSRKPPISRLDSDKEEDRMITERSESRAWRTLTASGLMIALALVTVACTTSSASPSASGSTGAATAGQFCKGTNIVFFPGGTTGGGFETVVYNGAKAAEAAFGPTVQYVWSDWDPNKMITQFQEAVATNPNGIAIMGHPGDDAFDPLVEAAEADGILVTSMNVELPNLESAYGAGGFGYAGPVAHDAGFALAQEAVSRGGLKAGDRAMVWGLKAQPGRGVRTIGVLDGLEAAGLVVDYLEIDDATNADPANGVSTFTGYASAHPDLKAIFIDHGNLTSTIPTYMDAAGLEPGSIYAAGFDLSPATVQGVKDGYVNLVIDQQQYLQGYLAILQLCLTEKYGFSGLFVNTGGGFVDETNIDIIAPLVDQQIR